MYNGCAEKSAVKAQVDDFYLFIDHDIYGSYLLTKWLAKFADCPFFKGILVREEQPSEETLEQRRLFHKKYQGEKNIIPEIDYELTRIYPSIDKVGRSMISLSGIPEHSPTDYNDIFFLGKNPNSEKYKSWLQHTCNTAHPWFFVYITFILKPWWVDISNRHVVNCHSAVLPYARGINSIENIAIFEDKRLFQKAAGVTVHYIDEGVDTGAIIRAERIADPFRFESLQELKGYTYLTGGDIYAETAANIIFSETSPVGIHTDPKLKGPNFLSKDFTPDVQQQAEHGYLRMKQAEYSKSRII